MRFHEGLPAPLKMFVHNLPIGVDLFFIISGFLIVYLLLAEKQETKSISMSKFYTRRALRIFPLYFAIIGLAYLCYPTQRASVDFSKYLYFWENFWMIKTGNWTIGALNPLWSICVEEHFYLVIPILVLMVPRDKVQVMFVSIILGSLFFRYYYTSTVQYNWMGIYIHTLSRCDLLAVGGLLAHYHHAGGLKINISWRHYLATVVYLCLLMSMVDSSEVTSIQFAMFKRYLFALPLVIIFIGTVLNENKINFIEILNNNKAINYLGKISFGLYMYHSLIGDVINRYFPSPLPHQLFPITVIILTILAATLSYELFEKQILKLKTRFEVIKTQNS